MDKEDDEAVPYWRLEMLDPGAKKMNGLEVPMSEEGDRGYCFKATSKAIAVT
jgi:hypothetical protein